MPFVHGLHPTSITYTKAPRATPDAGMEGTECPFTLDKGKPRESVGRKATGLRSAIWAEYGRRVAGRTQFLRS